MARPERETREEEAAAANLALAKLYLCCDDELRMRLHAERMGESWTAEGAYRNEGKESFLEKIAVTAKQDPRTQQWSFEIQRTFLDSGYGADQLREYMGAEYADMPHVSDIKYEVYLDAKGFHMDTTAVVFDLENSTAKQLRASGYGVNQNGFTIDDPAKQKRLEEAALGGGLEAQENLLFTLQHLEPVSEVTPAQA